MVSTLRSAVVVFAEVSQEKKNVSEIDVNPLNYPLPHKIYPRVNEPDQTRPAFQYLMSF